MLLNNKNLFKTSIIISYIVIEIILGVLIQTTSGILNTTSSFLAVVLAFLFSIYLLLTNININKELILLSCGLFCTVLADLFLVVIKPMMQLHAMIFFSLTQICYFIIIYLNQENTNKKVIHLIIRITITGISLLATVLVLKENTDALSLISLFYYANLISNIIFSFTINKINIIFSIGLILFACCDLLIGLNIMASSYLPIEEGTILYFLAHPGFNLAWVFYVPSQILISLSSITLNEEQPNK